MNPATIGRCDVRLELGRGGMATVYLAFDPRFEREVAIKVLPREFLHDPGFRTRFTREAKAIAALEHPAVVPVYDFGEEEGQPYLIMRYMPGGTLKDRLRKAPLPIDACLEIVARIAGALDEAHDQGLIHRDLKADNILFDSHNRSYLSDFGIVKLAQDTATLTDGAMVGTPSTMSPEQARGDPDIDRRSDVYSLGAVVYEILTGRTAYQADTPMGMAVKHLTEPVPSLRAVNPDIPAVLDDVVQRAMAKDREARFPTAGDLARALAAASRRETPAAVSAAAEDASGKAREAAITDVGRPTAAEPLIPGTMIAHLLPERRKRRRRIALVAVLLLAATGVGLAIGLYSLIAPASPASLPAAAPAASQESVPAEEVYPPVAGREASDRVAAFYYPWYGGPQEWFHWGGEGFGPPQDIRSDYFPQLGPYSSFDPQIVAQHFAWLREARVGVVVTSWWGQGSYEDRAVPLLLDMAERYGLGIAFHIEPYQGRSADSLVSDVRYLYQNYGSHPGFFRTNRTSLWSPDERERGLFFVFAVDSTGSGGQTVEAEYWRDSVAAIHALTEGGIVIANAIVPTWVDRGEFDGLYNYVQTDEDFAWSRGLPPGAWFVPSVIPGFSARRIGYEASTFVSRQDGQTYARQWDSALGTPVEPDMVAITSFNEWHEGTQIEPAGTDVSNGDGYRYQDYGPVGEDGYLSMTPARVGTFAGRSWPEALPARIRIRSASDWTRVRLIDGAMILWPELVFASPEASVVEFGGDQSFLLQQPLERATAGGLVEAEWDVRLFGLDISQPLIVGMDSGAIGWIEVEIYNLVGPEPVLIGKVRRDGSTVGEQEREFPGSELLVP